MTTMTATATATMTRSTRSAIFFRRFASFIGRVGIYICWGVSRFVSNVAMSGKGSAGTRLGSVYKQMRGACPLQISDYARCAIMQSTTENGLEKGSCEKEFNAMKECFRKSRGGIGRR